MKSHDNGFLGYGYVYDLRRPPRCKWDILCFGIWRSVTGS